MIEKSSKKIIFVVTEMRLGGRERVVGRIADGVRNYYNKVQIYSVWNRNPYFVTKVPIIFKEDVTWRPKSHKKLSRVTNNKAYKLLKSLAMFFVKWFFNYSFLQQKELNELINIIKNQEIDTVVLTDLTTTFAKKIKKECPKVKVVTWLHMEPKALFYKQYLSFQKELKNAFVSIDDVIALTDRQKREYAKYHHNVHSIANPMPDVNYKKLNTQIENNKKELLMVSRIDIEHKGLDILVNILSMIQTDWHLTFVGSGSEKDEKKFNKLIKEKDLQSKISLVGSKKGIELNNYYKEGYIFLLTSRFEGFPLSIGEAMSNGLPIISFDLDGVKEATGVKESLYHSKVNTPAFLVPFKDNARFAFAITELLNDTNRQKIMSQAGIKRAKLFSIDAVIAEWNKIL